MKRHFLRAGWLACLVASTALAQTAAPKLTIAATEHNVGEVKRGTEAKHTFVVKNEGNADLEIRNVAPS
jgi:ABC-type thiamine transport system substrate-binding protein